MEIFTPLSDEEYQINNSGDSLSHSSFANGRFCSLLFSSLVKTDIINGRIGMIGIPLGRYMRFSRKQKHSRK